MNKIEIKRDYQKSVHKIIEIAREMLNVPSVVSFEKPFINYIENYALKLGYNVKKNDKYIVVGKNLGHRKENRVLFSSHIDRHGMVRNEEGQIEYCAYWLKRNRGIEFKRDELNENEENFKKYFKQITGKEIFFDSSFARFAMNDKNLDVKFFLQDGTESLEKLALRYVREKVTSYNLTSGEKEHQYILGRYSLFPENHKVTYDIELKTTDKNNVFMINEEIIIKNEIFYGQIDNAISAATLFYLMENTNFKSEIIFTTLEEVGESHSCISHYLRNSNNKKYKLVVIDTSPYFNFDGKENGFLTLRHGDERGGFDKLMVEDIKSIMIKEEIPYDFKPSFLGRTELGKTALETNGKINGVTLQIPTMNYHTSYETSTLKSLENYAKIIDYIDKNFN